MNVQRLLLTLAALAAFVLFAGLGRWQLGRAEFKERQQQATDAALAAAPRALGDVLAAGATLPARVRAGAGRYLEPPLLLDNQVRGRRNGFNVHRAFQPPSGPAVLVDLGWVPWPPERQLPAVPAPADDALPHGLLLPWPGQALALAPLPQRPPRGPWLLPRLERQVLAEQLGVELFDGVLRLDAGAAHGFERDATPLAQRMPPERHRGYAVQWFALAALVAIVYGVLTWKHRPRR